MICKPYTITQNNIVIFGIFHKKNDIIILAFFEIIWVKNQCLPKKYFGFWLLGFGIWFQLMQRKDQNKKKMNLLDLLQKQFRKFWWKLKKWWTFLWSFDLSFASTETKFQNPITKTQNNFLVNTGFLLKLFQKKPKW